MNESIKKAKNKTESRISLRIYNVILEPIFRKIYAVYLVVEQSFKIIENLCLIIIN